MVAVVVVVAGHCRCAPRQQYYTWHLPVEVGIRWLAYVTFTCWSRNTLTGIRDTYLLKWEYADWHTWHLPVEVGIRWLGYVTLTWWSRNTLTGVPAVIAKLWCRRFCNSAVCSSCWRSPHTVPAHWRLYAGMITVVYMPEWSLTCICWDDHWHVYDGWSLTCICRG